MNTNLRNASVRMILAGLCALATAAPGSTQADAIAGLYPTGAGGTPGQADLNYTLVQAPAGVSLNTVIPSVSPSSWNVPPVASWLGLADNANSGFPTGEYTYQFTFDLAVLGIGLSLSIYYYRFRRPAGTVVPIELDPSTARRLQDNHRL